METGDLSVQKTGYLVAGKAEDLPERKLNICLKRARELPDSELEKLLPGSFWCVLSPGDRGRAYCTFE